VVLFGVQSMPPVLGMELSPEVAARLDEGVSPVAAESASSGHPVKMLG